MWNTSYGMYRAVLASMIHGMTVPASIEVAQRRSGLGKGLFEWLTRAPDVYYFYFLNWKWLAAIWMVK